MKKRVLIIHGWESNSREHWFLAAKERLEKLGYQVFVPDMPNTFYPKQEEWVKVIEDFKPDEDSILIGHSLGGVTILRYLEKATKKVGQSILIAAAIRKVGYKEIDNFFETDFDWGKIKESSKSFIILSQREDPIVNVQHSQDLTKHLGAKSILVEGKDHFDKIDFSLLEENICK